MKRSMSLILMILTTASLSMLSSCFLFSSASDPVSHSITPDSYTLAVISLDVFDSSDQAGTNKRLIDASADSPVLIDATATGFSGSSPYSFDDIFNDPEQALVSGTTYDAFSMELLYIEMSFDAAFHLPTIADEYGEDIMFIDDASVESHTLRLYFNAQGNFWKRDMAFQIADQADLGRGPESSSWYWMRRSLESGSATDAFISTDDVHPVSDIGPRSVIDLFDDEDFWGLQEDYDSTSELTVIDSNDDEGGLNANLIAFTYTSGDTLVCDIGIDDTFSFFYERNPDFLATDMASDADVVDFGPAVDGQKSYGDWGFHPFLPSIGVSAAED